MEATTQPRKRTLRRICTLGQIVGWATIAMGVLGIVALAIQVPILYRSVSIGSFFGNTMASIGELLTGVIILGTVQFIRYAIEESAEPRWLLRNVHLFLYLYALFLLLTTSLWSWPQAWNAVKRVLALSPENVFPMGRPLLAAMYALIALEQTLPKVLFVLGVAVVLRMVLPILGESKTLA